MKLVCNPAPGQASQAPEKFCMKVPYDFRPSVAVTVAPDIVTNTATGMIITATPKHESRVTTCVEGSSNDNCGCQFALPVSYSGEWVLTNLSDNDWRRLEKPAAENDYYSSPLTPLDPPAGLSTTTFPTLRDQVRCGDLPIKGRCHYTSLGAGRQWVEGDGKVEFRLVPVPVVDLGGIGGLGHISVDHKKELFALRLTRNVNLSGCTFNAEWTDSVQPLSAALLNNHPDLGSFANADPGSATLEELTLGNLTIQQLETGVSLEAADVARLSVTCQTHPDTSRGECSLPTSLGDTVNVSFSPMANFDPDIEITRAVPTEVTQKGQNVRVDYTRQGNASSCWFQDPGTGRLPDGSGGLMLATSASSKSGSRTVTVNACDRNGGKVQFTAGCTFARGTGTIDLVDGQSVTVRIPVVQLASPGIATGALAPTRVPLNVTSTEWGSLHRLELRQRVGTAWGQWRSVGEIAADQGRASNTQVTRTLTGLTTETQYQARVKAVAADGCSSDSAPASIVFTTPAPPSGTVSAIIKQPAGARVTQAGQLIKVRYKSTGSPSACRVRDHEGNWTNLGGIAVPGGAGRTRNYRAPSPLPDTSLTWTYTVECTYSAGKVEQGASVTIVSPVPVRPGRPELVAKTSSSLTVRTSDVEGATGYAWRISTDETFNSRDRSETSTVREVTIDNLEPGTRYYIDVKATSSAGSSEPSEHVAAVTLPSAPTLVSSTATSLTVRTRLVAGATYRWRISENSIVSNMDLVVISGVGENVITLDMSISGPLTPETTYYIDARHEGGQGGNGIFSDNLAAATLPPSPDTPWRTARTISSLSVATNARANATMYRWRISEDASVTDSDRSVTSETPSIQLDQAFHGMALSPLRENRAYHIDVRVEAPYISDYSGDLTARTAQYRGLVISPAGVTDDGIAMDEGTSSSIGVKLDGAPHAAVTVDLAWAALSSGDLTITSPPLSNGRHRLTFTIGNWNTVQTAVINAAADADRQNDTGSLVLTPGGDATHASKARQISVSVNDLDRLVSVSSNDVRWGTVTGGGTYRQGTDATVTATAKANHEFRGWYEDGESTPVSTLASYTFTVNGNLTLVARFKPDCILVRNQADSTISVTEGASSTVSVKLSCDPYETVPVTLAWVNNSSSDLLFTGSLSFDSSNYGTFQSVTISAARDNDDHEDETGTLRLTPRGTHTNTSDAMDVPIDVIDIHRLITVTSRSDQRGSVTGGGVVLNGDSVTVTAAAKANYEFEGWYEGGSKVTSAPASYTFTVNDHRTLQARFEPDCILVRNQADSTISVTEGASSTVSVKLSCNPHETVPVTLAWVSNSSSDLSFTGSLSFNSSNYHTFQSVTISAAIDADDHEDEAGTLRLTPGGAHTNASDAMDVPIDVIDIHRLISVTRNDDDWGTTTGGGVVPNDTDVSVTATANTNYVFKGWFEGSGATPVTTLARYTFSVNGHRTLQARFVPDCSLVVNPTSTSINEGASGNVSVKLSCNPHESVPVDITLASGTSSDLSITSPTLANTKRQLTFNSGNWHLNQTVTLNAAIDADDVDNESGTLVLTPMGVRYINGASKTKQTSISINDIHRRVTVTRNDDDWGITTGGGVVPNDTDVTVTATANTNYAFRGWFEGSGTSPVSTLASYTFRVNGHRTLQARFVPDCSLVVASNVTMDEGTSRDVGVKLSCDPHESVPVDITLTSSSSSDLTITAPTLVNTMRRLTFNSGNWHLNQTVTLNAAVDADDVNNETGTLVLTPRGTRYINGASKVERSGISIIDIHRRVTVTKNETLWGTVTGDDIYRNGDNATVTASASTNYAFRGWFEGSGTSPVSTLASYTFRMNGHRSLQARFVPDCSLVVESNVTMDEGTSRDVNVKLSCNPHESVPVDITLASGTSSDLTITAPTLANTKRQLTFNSGNWHLNQTVTLNAAVDADDVDNGSGTLVLTPRGTRYINGASKTEQTSISINDIHRHITVTKNETLWGSVTGGDIYRKGDSATVTASANTHYVFKGWYEGSGTSPVSTLASYIFRVNGHRTLQARFVPDCSLVVESNVIMDEGTSRDVGVKLSCDPHEPVPVDITLTSNSSSDLTITAPTLVNTMRRLTFNSGNWHLNQTVTLNAAVDADDVDNQTGTLVLTPRGARYINGAGKTKQTSISINDIHRRVTVTRNDDDWGITTGGGVVPNDTDVTVTATANTNYAFKGWFEGSGTSPVSTLTSYTFRVNGHRTLQARFEPDCNLVVASNVIMDEGTSRDVNVKLSCNPHESVPVDIALASNSSSDLSITAPALANTKRQLTFNSGNWHLNQTVTLNAAVDADDVDNETGTLVLTPRGARYINGASKTERTSISIIDIHRRITVNRNDDDWGTTTGGGVVLNDTDVTVTASASTNYAFKGWFESSGTSPVSTLTSYTFRVNSHRNLQARFEPDCSLVVNPSSTLMNEGATSNVSVRLSCNPHESVPVDITLTSNSSSDLSITTPALANNRHRLNFDSSNWDRNQTITINAAVDADDVDNESGTLVLTPRGTRYIKGTSKTVRTSISINDIHRRVTVTSDNPQWGTATGSGIYRIGANVTVTAAANTNYAFKGWHEDGESTPVTTLASYAFTVVNNLSLEARFEPDCSLVVNPSNTLMNEGATSNVSVRLSCDPHETVPVDITLASGSSSDLSITSPTLSNSRHRLNFDSGNWNVSQAVTINAARDNDDHTDETGTIVLMPGGTYTNASDAMNVPVEITDIHRLITLASNDDNWGSVTGGGVVMNGNDVTVTAAANTNFTFNGWFEGSGTSPVSTLASYTFRVNGHRTLQARFVPDCSLVVNPSSTSINEGASGNVSVKLSCDPHESVPVDIALASGSSSDLSITSPALANTKRQLTFNSGNWHLYQTVTLNAAVDADDVDNESGTLVLTPMGARYINGTSKTERSSISVNDIHRRVTVTSNNANWGTTTGVGIYRIGTNATVTAMASTDRVFKGWFEGSGASPVTTLAGYTFRVNGHRTLQARFVPDCSLVVASKVTMDEGASKDVNVKLSCNPHESVPIDVSLTGSPSRDLSITAPARVNSKRRLNFNSGNWHLNQTVTVSAAFDADIYDDIGYLNLIPKGPHYINGVSKNKLTRIVVLDADCQINVYSNNSQWGTAYGSGIFRKGNDVTVTATARDNFVFTGWYDGSSANLFSTQASYTFQVQDCRLLEARFKPVVAILGIPSNLTMNEGATYYFNVRLSANPHENVPVDITLASGSSSDLSIINSQWRLTTNHQLTFNSGNWNRSQAVRVNAAVDANDVENETGILILTPRGASYFNGVSNTKRTSISINDIHRRITVTKNETLWGTVTGDDIYRIGDNATVSASANTPYAFKGWYEGGSKVTNAQSRYTFRVNGNRLLHARFEPDCNLVVASNVTMDEGTPKDVNVKLSCDPHETVPVDITLAIGSSSDLSITAPALMYNRHRLTFDSSNYYISQTVTINAALDANDADNETGTLVLTPRGTYTNASNTKRTSISINDIHRRVTVSKNETLWGTVTGGNIYRKGDNATVTATANANYEFAGWFEGGSKITNASASYTFTVNDNRSLQARFLPEVTIEGISSSFSINELSSRTIRMKLSANPQEIVQVEIALRDLTNHFFLTRLSWTNYINGKHSKTFNSSNWDTYQSFIITSQQNPDSEDETGALMLTPRSSNTNASYTKRVHFTIIDQDHDISISSNNDLWGTVAGGGLHLKGTNATVTAAANTNFIFVGWFEGSGTTPVSRLASYTFLVNDERTLLARFKPDVVILGIQSNLSMNEGTTYDLNVKLSANPHETVPVDITLANGSSSDLSITLPAQTNGNHRLYFDSSNWENYQTVRIYAAFDANHHNDSGTLVLTPRGTYTNGDSKTKRASINVIDLDHLISVSTNSNQRGTVTGGGTYRQGTSVTVTATAKANNTFKGWYERGNRVSSSANYSFTATADRSLEARFQTRVIVTYHTISVSPNNASKGSVSGGGSYRNGTWVTVRATPTAGNEFECWYEGGRIASYNKNYSFTATSDRSLEARFLTSSSPPPPPPPPPECPRRTSSGRWLDCP